MLARITGAPSIHSDTGEWPFSAGPGHYHTVRFVYPMEIIGGAERREVDGSTDEFAWFSPRPDCGPWPTGDRLGDCPARRSKSRRTAAV